MARRELASRGIPLIGFSGAPFTLACYAIEGGSSRHQATAKQMMMSEPELWHRLMSKLAEMAGSYLLAQAGAGAQALQLFDSWCGELSPADYEAHALPYVKRAIEIASGANVPIILFGVGATTLLPLMASAGATVLGLDWRVDLGDARDQLGWDRPVQGNLDPIALLGSWEAMRDRARSVIARNQGKPGHIFNLGHGILPQTPVENVRRLVDLVHVETAR
jgi:uroporphyrinogen decarboxylase